MIAEKNPSRVQEIIRYLPHKISVLWFELTGGTRKTWKNKENLQEIN